VYDRLQKVGVSLSHNGMLQQMTGISGSFNSELIDSVRRGKKFRIVGDNVNFNIGVAQARKSLGKSGHMEHWFGSAAIIQNVDFTGLSDIAPQQDLRHVPHTTFLLSNTEFAQEVSHMSHLAAQILVEHFPWLKFAKAAMNEVHYPPPGVDIKNKVIPLPILHKNEQKYADVIDILDSYQELCDSTFESAEVPSQKVHIGGDQLTRERFSGARRLRAAAFTDTERLEGLDPITFELFHLQMTVLNTFFQILYDSQNTESFTLHSQKVRLLRKDADGNDVKNHYDSCKDLAESVIKAYVVEAACEHIGLPDTETVPENIPDYSHMTSEEIQSWLVDQVEPIINNVTKSTRHALNGTYIHEENPDYIYSYGNIVIELGLIYMELCDIVKNPNRDRLLQIMKYLMIVLKGHNNRSKYALEILRLLCYQYALLSEKSANETIYGLFVNTGKTIIPADLQMEYLVRLTKGHLRSMCSNVTEQSLVKRSSSFFGMNEISEHFDKETGTIKRAQKHKRLSSFDDERKIISNLRAVRPFLETPGRKVQSMKKSPKNPITKLALEDFIKWIEFHKVNLFYEL